MSSVGAGGTRLANEAPVFAENELRRVMAALPANVGRQGRARVRFVLREWARVDLPNHLQRMALSQPEAARARRKRLMALHRALNEIDRVDRTGIVLALFRLRGIAEPVAGSPEDRDFDEILGVLDQLAEATRAANTPPRPGRPRNATHYLILKDIAAMFEWATGRPARRVVDRTTGGESGAFHRFACVVWQIVFGSEAGLSWALRQWETYGRYSRYGEHSPLIANIAMRMEENRRGDRALISM
jgi:hypothetical protein